MREFRFRAWGKELKYMVYDGPFCYYSTVMQYIGLKDIHGKDIYAGDILSVINPDGGREKDCIVEWDEQGGCYSYEPEGGYGNFEISTIGWAMSMGYDFEVIGNIYEHPEILKEVE